MKVWGVVVVFRERARGGARGLPGTERKQGRAPPPFSLLGISGSPFVLGISRIPKPASTDKKKLAVKRSMSSDGRPAACCSVRSHAISGTALCLARMSAAKEEEGVAISPSFFVLDQGVSSVFRAPVGIEEGGGGGVSTCRRRGDGRRTTAMPPRSRCLRGGLGTHLSRGPKGWLGPGLP